MSIAVEVFESVAAVADHRTREGGERFFRNFDGAGNEELVVWDHEANVQRSTRLRKATAWQAFNVQRRNRKTWAAGGVFC